MQNVKKAERAGLFPTLPNESGLFWFWIILAGLFWMQCGINDRVGCCRDVVGWSRIG